MRSHAARDDYDDRLLVALVAVVADGHEVLVVGVHLDEGRVRGDRLDNHRQPSQPPTTLVLPTSSTGDTALTSHSVEHVSTWFDTILRRPVERLEWWHNGVPYAVRYQFADTCEALCEAYDRGRAPGGPWARLIAKGTPGGTRTGDLGPPDRAVPVRRDGDVVATPPLPPFVWYECPSQSCSESCYAATTYGNWGMRRWAETAGVRPDGIAVLTIIDSIVSGALSANVLPLRPENPKLAGLPMT